MPFLYEIATAKKRQAITCHSLALIGLAYQQDEANDRRQGQKHLATEESTFRLRLKYHESSETHPHEISTMDPCLLRLQSDHPNEPPAGHEPTETTLGMHSRMRLAKKFPPVMAGVFHLCACQSNASSR